MAAPVDIEVRALRRIGQRERERREVEMFRELTRRVGTPEPAWASWDNRCRHLSDTRRPRRRFGNYCLSCGYSINDAWKYCWTCQWAAAFVRGRARFESEGIVPTATTRHYNGIGYYVCCWQPRDQWDYRLWCPNFIARLERCRRRYELTRSKNKRYANKQRRKEKEWLQKAQSSLREVRRYLKDKQHPEASPSP